MSQKYVSFFSDLQSKNRVNLHSTQKDLGISTLNSSFKSTFDAALALDEIDLDGGTFVSYHLPHRFPKLLFRYRRQYWNELAKRKQAARRKKPNLAYFYVFSVLFAMLLSYGFYLHLFVPLPGNLIEGTPHSGIWLVSKPALHQRNLDNVSNLLIDKFSQPIELIDSLSYQNICNHFGQFCQLIAEPYQLDFALKVNKTFTFSFNFVFPLKISEIEVKFASAHFYKNECFFNFFALTLSQWMHNQFNKTSNSVHYKPFLVASTFLKPIQSSLTTFHVKTPQNFLLYHLIVKSFCIGYSEQALFGQITIKQNFGNFNL